MQANTIAWFSRAGAGLLLALVLATAAAGRSYLGGVMYLRDGSKVEVLRFLAPLSKDDAIQGAAGGESVKVRLSEVREVNLLTSDVNYIYPHSKVKEQTGTVSLVLRDGSARMLEAAYFDKGTLTYVVLTADGTQEERQVTVREVIKVRFDATTGRVRVCPLDQAAFPDDYLFCPYHGVPLVWGSP